MFDFFKKNRKLPAFSLMEVLIVVSLISILAISSLPIYGNFFGSAQLNENSSILIQTVRQARELSLNRFYNINYGVKFLPDSYVLYTGSSYASRTSSSDQIFSLNSALSLSTTLTDNEVNFSRGIGMPSSNGTVLLHHGSLGDRTIIINSLGVVSLQ